MGIGIHFEALIREATSRYRMLPHLHRIARTVMGRSPSARLRLAGDTTRRYRR
jgi:hypothetical protein